MFCENCGGQLPPNAVACPYCGAAAAAPQNRAAQPPPYPYPSGPVRQIPNHLVGSILVTLFCCLPFGIVAIVNAANVNGKVAAGDLAGAQASADKANTWMWVAFWVGLVVQLLNVAVYVIPAIAAAADY